MREPFFYVVPTPIGNLKDITLRAIDVLKSVDEILAEDTRKALQLLNHLNIKKTVSSYHKDNEKKISEKIINQIKKGKKFALISEAGTPCISDPGHFIVRQLLHNNIKFEVLPGATAFVPALIMSGFPTDHFFFYGFLKHKKSEKLKELNYLKNIFSTIILYESPHRIMDTISYLFDYFTPPFAVIREITKIYEETIFINKIDEITGITPKGEFVIVIDNNKQADKNTYIPSDLIDKLQKENFNKKEILKILKTLGFKRNEIYNALENTK